MPQEISSSLAGPPTGTCPSSDGAQKQIRDTVSTEKTHDEDAVHGDEWTTYVDAASLGGVAGNRGALDGVVRDTGGPVHWKSLKQTV